MSALVFRLSHYFLPGYSNSQKAKLAHPSSIFLVSVMLIVYQLVLQSLTVVKVTVLGYASNIPPETVISLTNAKRSAAGLSELRFNSQLAQAAKTKAEDMLARDYWAHVSPDGTQPWKFFKDAGYSYKYAGENLARDFSSPEAAVDAWMASPSHKDNLLSPKYTEIGVAVVEGDLAGVDTTLVVQLFGLPAGDVQPLTTVVSAKSTDVVGNTMLVSPTAIPTSAPTVIPSPTPQPDLQIANLVPGSSSTDGNTTQTSKILISPFTTTKGVSIAITFVLLVVMLIDGVVAAKRNIPRFGGRTFAHLAFLVMILSLVLIIESGKIL